jgi:ABC-type phosphate/phosphonate transport system substrate-binding protein
MPLCLAATAVHARPPPAEADSPRTRQLDLAWFVYEAAPAGCPHPGDAIAAYLTAKLNGQTFAVNGQQPEAIKVTAHEITNYSVGDALRGHFDLFYFTPYTYVLAERSIGDLQPLVSYRFHGARERFSTIVWKKTEGDTLNDLLGSLHADRRKKLALVDVNSTTGYLWPSRLLGGGLEISRGKVTTLFARSHDRALDALRLWPEVVAAASFDTHLAGYLAKYPGFENGLRSAVLTPPLPLDVIAARGEVAAEIRDAIRKAMTEMGLGDAEFRRCFQQKLEAWVRVDRSYYDLVRAFMRITEPPPPLRLAADCRDVRDWILEELRDWFSVSDESSKATTDKSAGDVLHCPRQGGIVDRAALRTLLGERRKLHPMTGYIDEGAAVDAASGERDLTANFGEREGLVPGMAAMIRRRVWLSDDFAAPAIPGAQGKSEDIPARITEVRDNGEVHLRAIEPDARLSLNQDLDRGDRLIMWVEVPGYSSDLGGGEDRTTLDIGVTSAVITPKGGMDVEYSVRLLPTLHADRDDRKDRSGCPSQLYPGAGHQDRAGQNCWGWLLETSRRGAPQTLELLPPGRNEHVASIPLGGDTLLSPLRVRLLGTASSARTAVADDFRCPPGAKDCDTEQFGFWSGFRVWMWVFIGGILGTALRWAGHLTSSAEPSPGRALLSAGGEKPPVSSLLSRHQRRRRALRFVARYGIEAAAGLGTALVLFLIFVTVQPETLKALDPNAIVTRIGIGILGGVIGAAGLGSIVHRLVGLKSPG